LRRLGGDGGGEQVEGQGEEFDRVWNAQAVEEMFMALGDEDGGQVQAAVQGFLDEMKAFEGNRLRIAFAGTEQRGP